ncbi:MAG: GntR family transcriptional regulator [Lachnospiraceae bacterium]|nr:GntR family transcriptional regulator [Lachnospiraceae bacterium]
MIVLDLKDARPLYEQIVERFKQLILRGVLSEDEKLPSVRTLAMELAINPNTIQKAYGELERQEFIYTVKGRGNFVSPVGRLREARKEELREQMRSVVREGEAIGMTVREFVELLEQMEPEGRKEHRT